MSVRFLLALDDEPLLGAGLQIVELLAEARQVYKWMRIVRFTGLQQAFRLVETCREAMCRKMQRHWARTILREGADAL